MWKLKRRIDVEIKIDKKFFIIVGVVVALCVASFCAGRYTILGRVESDSNRIEQSISGIDSSTDKISNDANNLGGILNTIGSNNGIAIEQIDYATVKNIELQSLLDECKSIIESSQRELEMRTRGIEAVAGTTDYILQLAGIKAEQDERTIARLTEVLGLSNESTSEQ